MITREQAMAMHPSNYGRLRAVWTPADAAQAAADFEAHAAQALAVVKQDTATVIDIHTRAVIA